MSDVVRRPAGSLEAFHRSAIGATVAVSSDDYDPRAPFKPWGIVWSGIRVDEFAGLGYDVTEDTSLEAGWIRPHPVDPSAFAVWSLADWRRLCALSAYLHGARRRGAVGSATAERIAGTPTVDLLELGDRLAIGPGGS